MSVHNKESLRHKRKIRIRKKIAGSSERPRLSVYRSSRYIYAQIVDDVAGKTLCAASSRDKSLKGQLKSPANAEAAKQVGKLLAERATSKKVQSVVFDRSGYAFHGRVRALAEGAREAGLKF